MIGPVLVWLVLLAVWDARPALAADVTIVKTDPAEIELSEEDIPAYTVRGGTYSAEVFPDGRVRILAGKTVVIENLVLDLERKVKTLGSITEEPPDRLLLREGTPPRKAKEPTGEGDAADAAGAMAGKLPTADLPGISLHFLPDRIEIGFLALRPGKAPPMGFPPAYSLSGIFGAAALAVKNLRNGLEDALPAKYICTHHIFSPYGMYGHYWPEIEVAYADGTKLTVRTITGISHEPISPKDPREAARVGRGFWSLFEAKTGDSVTLVVQPGDGKTTLGPAPYYTLAPARPKSLFYENERVLYKLEFAKAYLVPGKWRLRWTLEDHCQRPAGTGEQEIAIAEGIQPEVSVDLTPEAMGYFRARLVMSRVDGAAARRMHEVAFSRIRPEFPELRDLLEKGNYDGEMLWANILGMRGLRLNPSFSSIWQAHHTAEGDFDWPAFEKEYAAFLELARKGSVHEPFSFVGLDWMRGMDESFEKLVPDPEARKKKIEALKADYVVNMARIGAKLGVRVWEPVNEPNLGMSPEAYIENILKVQYPLIKQGDPGANFLGGSVCGLENHAWVRRLYELGGDKYFDGISLHPYTGVGFQESYRAELDNWRQILRDFNDTEQGIWLTESAWHRGWEFNDFVYDRFNAFRQSQARNAVLMHLNAEAMGIPRSRIYDFYLVEHGYNEFYLVSYTNPTAPAISIQVMNECLRDAKFVEEFPLPGKGHHFQLYRDDARTLAAVFTSDEPAEMTVLTDAGEVTVTDMMGNRKTVKPAGGRLRLTVTGDPTYLAVGAKQSLAPSYEGISVQPNLALATLGAKGFGSSGTDAKEGEPPQPQNLALSGDWTCYTIGPISGWRLGWSEAASHKNKFPDWYEVQLPAEAPIARVRIYGDYGAWEQILRDYDLQVSVNDQWRTVEQVRDNLYRYVLDHSFEPITSRRVRVLIHKMNACLFQSDDAWLARQSGLRAVEVYGPPAGPARAFFVAEIPKRRVLEPGGSTELRFEIRNILKTKLSGEVRLRLPEGIAAEPSARTINIPPDGEAVCSFRVSVRDKLADGAYTVLAGLYDGEALVSADYAARVLCVKTPPPPPKPPEKNDQRKEETKRTKPNKQKKDEKLEDDELLQEMGK